MTKKEELYCLMALYKDGRYSIADFCDELTRIIYYENSVISELEGYERQCFEDLGNTAKRHTPYKKDRKLSKWFCGDDKVIAAIEKAFSQLEKHNYLDSTGNYNNSSSGGTPNETNDETPSRN